MLFGLQFVQVAEDRPHRKSVEATNSLLCRLRIFQSHALNWSTAFGPWRSRAVQRFLRFPKEPLGANGRGGLVCGAGRCMRMHAHASGRPCAPQPAQGARPALHPFMRHTPPEIRRTGMLVAAPSHSASLPRCPNAPLPHCVGAALSSLIPKGTPERVSRREARGTTTQASVDSQCS